MNIKQKLKQLTKIVNKSQIKTFSFVLAVIINLKKKKMTEQIFKDYQNEKKK